MNKLISKSKPGPSKMKPNFINIPPALKVPIRNKIILLMVLKDLQIFKIYDNHAPHLILLG